VTLVGLAGQISLCQMSLAGIGALVAARLGTDGQPWALLLAALVAGVVGALIALPALRLSGIYLALATAAFAMVLDRWLFNIPELSVFGLFDVRLFGQDAADVAPLSLFGFTFDTARSQMILGAVVFSLLALGVVALRRGRLGRRLLAVKDSEAACATLGGSILVTKVTVFFLSSAIAGLGGALYAMQLRSVDATSFDLVSGLPILVLAVVGGIATVGGALFVGLAFTGLLPALVAIAPGVEKLAAVLPGLAGVMLGRNPNGAVADMRDAARPIGSHRLAWGTGLAVFVVAYLLRVTGVIASWPFAVFAVGSFVVAFAITRIVTARHQPAEPAGPVATAPAEVPLEWRGLVRPWTPDDVAEMDAALGLAPGEVGAGARG
jgi:branched-chain amino acid transport system permease protein